MNRELLIGVYWIGLAVAESFRIRHRLAHGADRSGDVLMDHRAPQAERVVLAALLMGVWVLPLVHAVTGLLAAADYVPPPWAVPPALALFALGLAIRWRAQRDLGHNWSSTLTLWHNHRLVTHGIYAHVRHPIYAALCLWGLAQPFLLWNWVAGLAGPLAIALLCALRIPREEAMLRERFGPAYAVYAQRTGALLPRLRSGDAGSRPPDGHQKGSPS